MKIKNLHIILGLTVLIIIIAAIVVVTSGSQENATRKLKEAYSVLGANIEVLSIKEESGVYRVVLRQPNSTTVQEIYITKDGNLLLRNVERLQDFTSRILREDNFSQCLASKRLVVFGSSNDLNTLQQLQVIGSFSGRVFFDCSTSLQTCLNLNITQIPATVYQNQVYFGVQPAGFFAQLTGCSL